jgi:hypothetical protein
VEYLPERLLAKNAETILPIIIFEESTEKNVKKFDLGRTMLMNQIVKNLPESSLVVYILPFSLKYLETCPTTDKYASEKK